MPKPRSYGHLTPRYVVSRLRQLAFEYRNPRAPWLTRQAVAFLEQWLRTGDSVLEWGSGRSTLWFAPRVRQLWSVEHNEGWYRQVLDDANRSEFSASIQIELASVEIADEYVNAHPDLIPESVDVCLIDGAFRALCAKRALSLVRPGGLIVVDNVERYLWHPKALGSSPNSRERAQGNADSDWDDFAEHTREWRTYWTTDGVSDSAIFFAPTRSE
ncbi:MAG: hypothetical protein AAFU77_16025 [Myxococcota bacterium]